MVAIDDIGLDAEPAPVHRVPESTTSASWTAWGMTATVTVTDARALASARRLVARHVASIEAVASRFRRGAEVHQLYRAGGRAISVSPLLADLISAALITAERTGGDVDPTVSSALNAAGGRSAERGQTHLVPVCSTRTGVRPAPGWQQVHLHGRRLQVPAGTTLDLTATAKAVACDRAAARVADRLGVGALVQLGGDVATAGPAPQDGWTVRIRSRDGRLQCLVALPPGAAIATSYLTACDEANAEALRQGRTAGVHVIDPRTGRPPEPVWQQVSALGFSCLEATAYTTAALVRGTTARAWLSQLWVPARLMTVGGDVLTVGPWESHERAPSMD
jgi:thiamine biosynthesis lipoprotein